MNSGYFDEWSLPRKLKVDRLGRKEIYQFALKRYGEAPFIIELHDTPVYVALDSWFALLYPETNKKLGSILNKFKGTVTDEKVDINLDDPKYHPSRNSLTVECWPVRYNDGKFKTLEISDEEKFVRRLVDFLQTSLV